MVLVGGGGSVRVRRTEEGERMRAREGERGTGRVGEGRGECVAPSGASSGEQVSRRWPGLSGARATPRSFWRGGRRQGSSGGGLGRAAGPGGLPGEHQVRFLSSLLFLFNSVFYFL